MKIPRIMISGASSGCGKTTVVCGIINALKKRGLNIAACKVGPDFIDTMFHMKTSGLKTINLDSFFCNEADIRYLFAKHGKNADIVITEGVMGYYDGIGMNDTCGSSYDIALKLKMPVITVINARGAALTAAALIKGIAAFRENSGIKGVILNNISAGIYKSLKETIEKETGVEVIGFMPMDERCKTDSRHLGLVTPDSIRNLEERIDILGEYACSCINLDRLIEIAENSEEIHSSEKIIIKGEGVRIAVAKDKAFSFYYNENISLLEEMGAEIVYFSPLNDSCLPDNIDGIIIGGGYPELYCNELEANIAMRNSVKEKINNGIVCIAECGGFMYLHEKTEGADGRKYEMAGVIRGECIKRESLVRFGYIDMTAEKDSYLMKKGEKIRGHEFHYWDSTDNGELFTAVKPSGKKQWKCMREYKNLICGFPHIYYYSNIGFAENFLAKCRMERERKKC